MRFVTGLLLSATLLALVSACGEDYVTSATPTPAATASKPAGCSSPLTASDNFNEKVSLTTAPDGLQSGDLVTGTGPAVKSGDKVTVQYTGWLTDGSVFDSSRQPGRSPFSFTVGQGSVIKGWDEGVPGMKVCGKRRLVIPGALGYGAQGSPPKIPANATLIFDITLVRIG